MGLESAPKEHHPFFVKRRGFPPKKGAGFKWQWVKTNGTMLGWVHHRGGGSHPKRARDSNGSGSKPMVPCWGGCTTHFGIGMFIGGTIWLWTHDHLKERHRSNFRVVGSLGVDPHCDTRKSPVSMIKFVFGKVFPYHRSGQMAFDGFRVLELLGASETAREASHAEWTPRFQKPPDRSGSAQRAPEISHDGPHMDSSSAS